LEKLRDIAGIINEVRSTRLEVRSKMKKTGDRRRKTEVKKVRSTKLENRPKTEVKKTRMRFKFYESLFIIKY